LVGANPWQIHKDLSYFGDFGTRGVGYDTEKLAERIKKILKLKTTRRAALVGVGNLGAALLAYPGFAAYGFDIAATFDANPKKMGIKIHDMRIESASQLHTLGKRGIDIATYLARLPYYMPSG